MHALGTAAEAAVASEDFGKARALYSQLLQHTQARPLVLAAARAEVSLVRTQSRRVRSHTPAATARAILTGSWVFAMLDLDILATSHCSTAWQYSLRLSGGGMVAGRARWRRRCG